MWTGLLQIDPHLEKLLQPAVQKLLNREPQEPPQVPDHGRLNAAGGLLGIPMGASQGLGEIGRASCRERV